MWASDRGNIQIVDLLLNKGANPNITSKVAMSRGEWGSTLAAAILSMYVVYRIVFIDDCKS